MQEQNDRAALTAFKGNIYNKMYTYVRDLYICGGYLNKYSIFADNVIDTAWTKIAFEYRSYLSKSSTQNSKLL
jgi:hypothetical protein